METNKAKENIAAAVINLIEAGFWPPNRELQAAGKFIQDQEAEIERLREDNDRLKAALNPFAKLGEKLSEGRVSFPQFPIVDLENTHITYADLIRAAEVLYSKDRSASEEKKE